mmetsp:Transcript_41869/g.99386  ORF Transcript_41869/g.99386 Transcript_41869/m.99386 type:complete len:279 (-) Transcript_41869:160-996(-)
MRRWWTMPRHASPLLLLVACASAFSPPLSSFTSSSLLGRRSSFTAARACVDFSRRGTVVRVSRRVEMGATGVRAMGMHDDVEALKEELARTRRELEFAHEELKVERGIKQEQERVLHLSSPSNPLGWQEGLVDVGQLMDVVDSLASCPEDGGCPWTAEQGALDVLVHAVSELEEIRDELLLGPASDHNALQSELGDLLFNTLLLIKVCERDQLGGTTLSAAARFATAKVRRRAPFVFADDPSMARPLTPEDASAMWKQVKKKEKMGLIPDAPKGFEKE